MMNKTLQDAVNAYKEVAQRHEEEQASEDQKRHFESVLMVSNFLQSAGLSYAYIDSELDDEHESLVGVAVVMHFDKSVLFRVWQVRNGHCFQVCFDKCPNCKERLFSKATYSYSENPLVDIGDAMVNAIFPTHVCVDHSSAKTPTPIKELSPSEKLANAINDYVMFCVNQHEREYPHGGES